MSAFMLIQDTDSLARSCIFSIPMWLKCNWSSTSFCNVKGMITHLPFIDTPSLIARSCFTCQYPPKLGSKSSLFCGYPLIMCACSICSSASSLSAALMFSIDAPTGMASDVLSVCMLILRPAISWFLLLVLL